MHPLISAAAIAAALTLAAGPAQADSITYTDGGNVWIAAPDGSVKRQLTTNATDDLKYFGPSQADNGKIAVIYGKLARGTATMRVLSATGDYEKSGLLQMDTCGAFGQFPSAFGHARIDPGGEVIAYDYLCTNTDVGGGTNVYTAVTSATSPGVMVNELRAIGAYLPNWLTRKSGDFHDMIATQQGGQYLSTLAWRLPLEWQPVLQVEEGLSFGGASVARNGTVLAYEVSNESTGTHQVIGMRLDKEIGPDANIVGECVVAESRQTMLPSVSPDGTRVTWDDEGGVKVATFTVPAGATSGPCADVTTITIAPNGINPVYNGAAAPTGGGNNGGGTDNNGGGADNGGGAGGGDNGGTQALTVKGPSTASLKQVRKGLTFSTKCAGKCTVKARMKVGAKTVAKDTMKLKRKGTAKVTLKAKLKPSVRSVTVVVSNGQQSGTRTVTITK